MNLNSMYKKFVEDYCNPQLTVSDIRRNLQLNSKRYMEIRNKAVENGDIPPVRRMNRSSAKFYTKTSNGYVVKKQFGKDCCYIGRFEDETTAQLVVSECKKVNWNVDMISDFIDKYRIKPRNYTATAGQFTVQKSINGKNRVFCTVDNETVAQKIVDEFRECNWDATKTSEIIKKVEA